jgi:diguanylate cyclase (GGDEF)-like protein
MGKWPKPLWDQEKVYIQLASNNREATEAYNEKMLSALTLIGGLLMLLPLAAVPFSNTKAGAVPAYLLGILFYLGMFLVFRLPAMRRHTLLGLYICFSGFFLFSIFLSTIHSPGTRATILLGAFCIMPHGFIDRPIRMNLFVAFWFAVHTVLAFSLKPRYALDDTINCLCFAILGCFLGNKMVRVRLESYEARRLLIIEKETDVLTGLSNRRKLFEALAALETEEAEKPSGILMLDIDHFKEFNDSFGHAAGDRCLGHFGEALAKFAQNFRLHFYRYGGEEFVAIAYGYDQKELFSIAESLRIAVQGIDMDGFRITVSIGAAYCGDERVQNYEKVIDRADRAAYVAKRAGRNSVCMEQNEMQV